MALTATWRATDAPAGLVRRRAPAPGPAGRALRPAKRPGYIRVMDSDVDRVSSSIEAVVQRFRALVRSAGVRRGLAEADLDEVVQEVRIRLWRAGEAGKVLEELGSSYLYHVATSAALDVLRRRRAHGAADAVDVEQRRELPARTSSPEADLEAQELATQIDAALETLSLERRVAVRFHLSGYDRDDIARALGWSEAKTRNLLYRGLDDLRRRLEAMGVAPRRAG
ncbi:MAG TPA: sigma-70 family RNA polymerase sigma factor [Vicinamibacterales bacterium]